VPGVINDVSAMLTTTAANRENETLSRSRKVLRQPAKARERAIPRLTIQSQNTDITARATRLLGRRSVRLRNKSQKSGLTPGIEIHLDA
jgi:hypothetical protein